MSCLVALVFDDVEGVRSELPMAELRNYGARKDRMLARPAVQRVVEDEKLKV